MSANLLFFLVFYPMAGAVLSYLIGRRSKEARNFFADFVVVSEFLAMLYTAVNLRGTDVWAPEICGMGLHFTTDGFRAIYGLVAAFMWMMTIIFSREYFAHYRNRNRYYLFQLVTLGATMGVFLSANLYTTFIFFEIMSFTSYVWVAQDERKESLRAAETYLAVAVIGGMVLLMGLFLLYDAVGTLEINDLFEACRGYENKARLYAAGGCILVGFGAKAGAFPLHIWLPKAYPVAPAPASALLSGILTKAGVYGILIISCQMFFEDHAWGILILTLGTITMFGGALLAVFSVDLKRTLACSSMSQIGFILVGIGMQCLLGEENGLAVHGTFLHMMNHSLIKLVLFMAAGVVYMNLHQLNLNEIRGFGRKKPLLNFAFLMGALGIGGIPLWNGYISKTLLHESIVEYSTAPVFKAVEWIFLISGGLTVAYMLKLYISIFFEKNEDPEKQKKFDSLNGRYMNKESVFAIVGSAVILPILGMTATRTMIPLATLAQDFMHCFEHVHTPHFFSFVCLKGGLISIAIGVLVYVVIIRHLFLRKKADGTTEYADLWPAWLDMENRIYRPVILKVLPFIGVLVCRIGDSLVDSIIVFLRKTVYRDRKLIFHTGHMPRLTDMIGDLLDMVILRSSAKEERRFRTRMRFFHSTYEEERERIESRLSFGLELAGIGMVFVFVYLLL